MTKHALPPWHAVVVAAGDGRRLGCALRKAAVPLAGVPMVVHSIRTLAGARSFAGGVVVVHPDDLDRARGEWLASVGSPGSSHWCVVAGGPTRAVSVQAGIQALPSQARWVAIHDAARPLVDRSDIEAVVGRATEVGAAILASPVVETLKRVREGRVCETVDRSELWRAETPQVARIDCLTQAYADWPEGDTDDAAVLERAGVQVAVVPSRSPNPKITVPADLRNAEGWIASGGADSANPGDRKG